MTVTVRNAAGGAYYVRFSNPTRGTVAELRGTTFAGTGAVLSIEVTHDFEIGCATGSIVLARVPAGVTWWDQVHIEAGATPLTMATIFDGYVVPISTEEIPRQGTLQVRGKLIRAQRHPAGSWGGFIFDGASGHWVDYNTAGDGMGTEVAMIGDGLQKVGFAASDYALEGTGWVLGSMAGSFSPGNILPEQYSPYAWGEAEALWSVIQRLDAISCAQGPNGVWGAYRTCDSRTGLIKRPLIQSLPAGTPAATFTEGVDIEQAEWIGDPSPARTAFRVSGFTYPGGTSIAGITTTQVTFPVPPTRYVTISDPTSDPWGDHPPEVFSSPLIENEQISDRALTTGGDRGIACEEVLYTLAQRVGRVSQVFRITTPRDDPLDTGQTIAVNAPDRLGVSGNAWIGAIRRRLDERGWRMDLTGVYGTGSTPGFDPGPTGSFTILVEQETVVVAGVETTLYVVTCTAAFSSPSGTISSYSWTASGGTPASGNASSFVTSYTALSGQSISCTVADSNGAAKTVTQIVPSATAGTVVRRALYLAGTDTLDALDPTPAAETWRRHAATAGVVVANGPLWADGDTVWRSADYGVTWQSSVPHTGTAVTALWMETDVSGTLVLAGLADGHVWASDDAGATWAAAGRPSTNPILKVVINRFSTGQWFALTAAHYRQSLDGGATWTVMQAAGAGETFADVGHSADRGYLLVGDAGGGTPLGRDSGGVDQDFTALTCAGLVAVAPRIQGGYAAYDSAGKTLLEPNGATSFVAGGANLPAGGTVEPRGLWRDGVIVDLFYVAKGASGVYKSLDAFGSAGGYFLVRKPGVGSSPAGAVYTQVGADGLLATAQIAATTVYSGTSAKAKSLWNGSGSGTTQTFADGPWTATVTYYAHHTSSFSADPATTSFTVRIDLSATDAAQDLGVVVGASYLGTPLGAGGLGAYNYLSNHTGTVFGASFGGWPHVDAITVDVFDMSGAGTTITATVTIVTTGAYGATGGNDLPPAGWQDPSYDDAGWSAAVQDVAPGGAIVAGSEAIWSSVPPLSDTEQALLRQTLSLPSGAITDATLTVLADDAADCYVNGVYVGTTAAGGGTFTVPAGVLLPGATNLIAAKGTNSTPTHAWVSYALAVS